MNGLRITLYCGFLLGALQPVSSAVAEESPSSQRYELPVMYVSASRLAEEGMAAATRHVVVIEADELQRRAAADLSELLSTLPGVDVRTRGPLGVQGDLEVDGATFNQVLVLVDGIRVNDPQTDHHTLNLPLAPSDLERVEILYGAGSSVHGPDAFGAVVNLVPRAQAPGRLDIAPHWGRSLDGGRSLFGVPFGDFALRQGWTGRWGELSLSAGKRRSDGYRDGTDYDEDRLNLRTRLPVAGGRLTVNAGVQDKAFGAADFYAPFPSREWTRVYLYSTAFQRRTGERTLSLHAALRRHRDRFVLVAEDPDRYQNRHRSHLGTVEVYGGMPLAGGRVVAGAEGGRETIDSSNLGDHSRVRFGLFTEYGLRRGAWNLSAGLRTDHHEGAGWEASPSIGLARWQKWGRVYATAARAYRAPSFTEFYYRDPRNIGNPDLEAERGWHYEAGAETQALAGVRTLGALFLRRENNLVDYIRTRNLDPEASPDPWQARNLGEMETVGARLQTQRRWRYAGFQAAYTWIDKEQTLSPGLESKYVFTNPTQQLTAAVDHDLPFQLEGRWQMVTRARTAPLEDFSVVDVMVSRSTGYGRLIGRVRNLTDKEYESVAGARMPGRWFTVEARIDL
ncbi:MAG: TonB-dependent receptor [Candidatus Latescibacterota bacterium]|nr:TonB-dependent receptor [Candidatus Latescibacterota bacterium]